MYSESGLTIKQEMIARVDAITSTVLFATNAFVRCAILCKSAASSALR